MNGWRFGWDWIGGFLVGVEFDSYAGEFYLHVCIGCVQLTIECGGSDADTDR